MKHLETKQNLLLNKNNKTLLTKQDSDNGAGNTNGGKYIDANSTVESNNKTPKAIDVGGLSNGSTQKSIRDTAPDTFKDECGDRAKGRVISEQDEAYKEVENYCSKQNN